MVLCEWDGSGDWRSERFLSVNGILTPKRCCFVVFIRVHALFLVVEQTAIKIWIIVCGSSVWWRHALVVVTTLWCWVGACGSCWQEPCLPPSVAAGLLAVTVVCVARSYSLLLLLLHSRWTDPGTACGAPPWYTGRYGCTCCCCWVFVFVWWCEVFVAASMDDQSRGMMHPTSQTGMLMPQHYGMGGGSVDPSQGTTTPDNEGRKQDINTILEQIMNITDQSLDEAQARWAPLACYFGRRWWRRRRVIRPLHPLQLLLTRMASHVYTDSYTHSGTQQHRMRATVIVA